MTNDELLEDLTEIRNDAEVLRDSASIEANEFPYDFDFDVIQEIVDGAENVMFHSDKAIRLIKRMIEDEGEFEMHLVFGLLFGYFLSGMFFTHNVPIEWWSILIFCVSCFGLGYILGKDDRFMIFLEV